MTRPVHPHLNPNVQGLRPSATVAINDRCNRLRAQGRDIFKLGLGQSPFPVPPSVVDALREGAPQKDYLPVSGLRSLREAIAKHHCRTFEIDCEADQVLIGPGSKELMFLLQLTYQGELLIPAPSWVSYEPQARILGRRVRWIQTAARNRWLISASQLDELCAKDPRRPRLLILNYPSNPTGATYSAADLRDIAEVARKYGVLLLSDEIYGKLHHTGGHTSIAPMYPEGTIFSGGLSKWCGAGGWRLGIFVVPAALRWLLDAMSAVATETFTSTSAPIQHAAVTAFRGGPELDTYLHGSRRILAPLGAHLTRELNRADVDTVEPQGGFYVFPDFTRHTRALRQRGITSSAALCERLLDDTGVAILPGVDFGRPPEELTARIAYVDFDGAAALRAAAALGEHDEASTDFLLAHCGRVLEAVDRIVGWLGTR